MRSLPFPTNKNKERISSFSFVFASPNFYGFLMKIFALLMMKNDKKYANKILDTHRIPNLNKIILMIYTENICNFA